MCGCGGFSAPRSLYISFYLAAAAAKLVQSRLEEDLPFSGSQVAAERHKNKRSVREKKGLVCFMELYIVLAVIVLALAYVAYNYFRIKKMDEGTADMKDMAKIIRDGAATFMKTEYKTIAIVVVIVALVFSLFIEKTAGLTLILGAAMSSIVCVLGMNSATYANVRTANKARETLCQE